VKYAIRKNPRDIRNGSLVRSAEPWWDGRLFVADGVRATRFESAADARLEVADAEAHSYVPVAIVEVAE
jgi:hypothetical protein